MLGILERRLVMCCISRDLGPQDDLRSLVQRPLDWNAILVAGLWHKVAFLIYEHLCATGTVDVALLEGNLPLLVLNHWKQLAKVNALRSSAYIAAATELCDAAARAGIDLVVAKGGIPLFGTVYSRLGRKTYDVDFLARRQDFRALEQLFNSCGFVYGEYCHATETLGPVRPADLRKHLLQGRGLPNFVRQHPGEIIDYLVAQVRFRIGSGSAAGRWVHADPLINESIVRNCIRVVSWRDLALQLALHVYREAHEPEYVQWNMAWNLVKLCDFDRIVHSDDPDLIDGVIERATELGFLEELAFAALATHTFFPSPVLACLIERTGVDPASLNGERTGIEEAVWSTGSVLHGQHGGWFDVAGSKTT